MRGRPRQPLLTRARSRPTFRPGLESAAREKVETGFSRIKGARNSKHIQRRIENVELQSGRAILNVRHLTTYRYKRPVEFGEHRMMMRPRDGHDQRLLQSELDIEPEPRRLRWLYDTFDNCVAVASFSGAWTSLRVENRFTVERIVDEQPGGEIDPRAQFFPFSYLRRSCPTSRGRSSACIAIRPATSTAGRASS